MRWWVERTNKGSFFKLCGYYNVGLILKILTQGSVLTREMFEIYHKNNPRKIFHDFKFS